MHGESVEVRLARLEEAMVSVKGDTGYLRRNFDAFQERYWEALVKATARAAGTSAAVSFIVGVATVWVARKIWT